VGLSSGEWADEDFSMSSASLHGGLAIIEISQDHPVVHSEEAVGVQTLLIQLR
jgi:hypothetical protein